MTYQPKAEHNHTYPNRQLSIYPFVRRLQIIAMNGPVKIRTHNGLYFVGNHGLASEFSTLENACKYAEEILFKFQEVQ